MTALPPPKMNHGLTIGFDACERGLRRNPKFLGSHVT